eukprot:jgi/Chlat1/5014/Chrsp32S04976
MGRMRAALALLALVLVSVAAAQPAPAPDAGSNNSTDCSIHTNCFDEAMPNFETGVGFQYYDEQCTRLGGTHCVDATFSGCRSCATFRDESDPNMDLTLPLCPVCVCRNYGAEVCMDPNAPTPAPSEGGVPVENGPGNGNNNDGTNGGNYNNTWAAPVGAHDKCFAQMSPNVALRVSYQYYDEDCLDGGLLCIATTGCKLCKLATPPAAAQTIKMLGGRRLLRALLAVDNSTDTNTDAPQQPICPGVVCAANNLPASSCLSFPTGNAPPPPTAMAPGPSTGAGIVVYGDVNVTAPAGTLLPFSLARQRAFASGVAEAFNLTYVTPDNVTIANFTTLQTGSNGRRLLALNPTLDAIRVVFGVRVSSNANANTVASVLQQLRSSGLNVSEVQITTTVPTASPPPAKSPASSPVTAPAPVPSTSSTEVKKPKYTKGQKAAIIAGTIGGFFLLVAVIALICCVRKRKNANKNNNTINGAAARPAKPAGSGAEHEAFVADDEHVKPTDVAVRVPSETHRLTQ